MNIQWFGHSCFRIETKGPSILIDPYSKDLGLRPPKIKDDIVLVTHPHYDHNNVEGAASECRIIDGPGEYEINQAYIYGIPSFHDNSRGAERGLNTIFIIKSEEMSVCHMGDFGQDNLEEHQLEEIGEVDILMVPIGGKYTIDGKKAVGIVNQIEPKIVVPMHYKISGLKLDIDGPEKFLKEIGITPEKTDKLRISKKSLPVEEIKLVMFTP